MFNPCIIIPVFKHAAHLKSFIQKLPDLPIIIIDDGNPEPDAQILSQIADSHNAALLKLKTNQGKNRAVLTGMQEALKQGYTHALQIDADGQHNAADITKFLDLAKQNPNALINGSPLYDNDAPKSRTIGRKITNFWIMIETWSFDIKDAMCGFRVYPLHDIHPIIKKGLIFNRMGGDIEIIVKSHWQGIRIINIKTKVIYPQDGLSNFKLLKDNIKISLLHTTLFFGMLKHQLKRLFKCKKN